VSVEGTHPGDDGVIIEIYADPEDEAAQYLGETSLEAGSWRFDLAAPLTRGHYVSATATDDLGSTSVLSVGLVVP